MLIKFFSEPASDGMLIECFTFHEYAEAQSEQELSSRASLGDPRTSSVSKEEHHKSHLGVVITEGWEDRAAAASIAVLACDVYMCIHIGTEYMRGRH